MNCTRDEALEILALADSYATLSAIGLEANDRVLLVLSSTCMDTIAKLLGHKDINSNEYKARSTSISEKVGRAADLVVSNSGTPPHVTF